MSITPQMGQLGQQGQQQGQQFPSTSPYQQQGGLGSLEQLQQLGQQQPYQQLIQQLGGQQQQNQQEQQILQLTQSVVQQVQTQSLDAGVADAFIDIVVPLPGLPQQIFLRVNGQFRSLANPSPQLHQQIQEAFAFGHQVIGVWDGQSPNVLRSVRIQRF
ncbi:hypothetical protein AB0D34_10490 [Streptomyces sp. NPDC048420]|uniref:hypothetical protein n=1 Tax=Streptomyces sp. NPDC048420 TaxID=3155755 RepID=UPI00342B8041